MMKNDPAPVAPKMVTPEMKAAVDKIYNATLNANFREIDLRIQEMFAEPEMQMGVLMMVQAMTFARIRRKHKITGAKRKLILRKATEDFERKIREFGWDDVANDSGSPTT